jgi:hypothetical protein
MRYGVGMEKKTDPFSMRLDPAMKTVLLRFALADGRSLSNYIENLLRLHIIAKAHEAANKPPRKD